MKIVIYLLNGKPVFASKYKETVKSKWKIQTDVTIQLQFLVELIGKSVCFLHSL